MVQKQNDLQQFVDTAFALLYYSFAFNTLFLRSFTETVVDSGASSIQSTQCSMILKSFFARDLALIMLQTAHHFIPAIGMTESVHNSIIY